MWVADPIERVVVAASMGTALGSTGIGIRTRATRLGNAIREELSPSIPWVWLSSAVCRLLPPVAFSRLRAQMLRLCGWSIGKRPLILGVPRFRGTGNIQSRLIIGDDVVINEGCLIELAGRVTIGDGASLGHGVHLLTANHRLGTRERRAGLLESGDITVGAGAWIGSKTVVLPNVTIGEGAVVSANSLVSRAVPANCVVAGVPAVVVVKRLPG